MGSRSVAERVLEEARTMEEGSPIRAKALLHLGSRAAVDQALSRLARQGALLRVARGIYCLPVSGAFGPRSPETVKVVEALAKARGTTIVESGGAAAHALGLTTQVPVRPVYWTSGRSLELKLGRQRIRIRRESSWKVVLPQTPAGAAIRALAAIPREEVPRAVRIIGHRLARNDIEQMLGVRDILPGWLAAEVSKLARGKTISCSGPTGAA